MLKAPKFDPLKMLEMHGDAVLPVPEETGIKVEVPAAVVAALEVAAAK